MPALVPGTSVALDALAPVAPGALVSRVLLKSPAGSATVFAFAAGETMTEHATPSDALLVGLTGEVEVTLAGETHRLAAGDALAMAAHAPHALHAPTDARVLLVLLRDPR